MASSSRAILRGMSAISRVTQPVASARASSRLFSTTPSLGPRSTTRAPVIPDAAPPSLDDSDEIPVLPPTQYRPRTHGHHVATITFKGFSSIPAVKENIVFFSDFAARAAYAFGIPVSGSAPAPNRRALWTVIKGPFVHKKAQENFERITSKRSMKVYDADEEVIEKWLHYLRIHSMIGVKMRAEIFRRRPVGIGFLTYKAARERVREEHRRIESNAAPQVGAPLEENKSEESEQPAAQGIQLVPDYRDSVEYKEGLAAAHFIDPLQEALRAQGHFDEEEIDSEMMMAALEAQGQEQEPGTPSPQPTAPADQQPRSPADSEDFLAVGAQQQTESPVASGPAAEQKPASTPAAEQTTTTSPTPAAKPVLESSTAAAAAEQQEPSSSVNESSSPAVEQQQSSPAAEQDPAPKEKP